MRDLNDVNEEINKYHRGLITQLKSTSILYVDLMMYYREIERLKMERDMILMERM